MNRNVLKYIAVVAMTMDHCAAVFLYAHPELNLLYCCMRLIGRLTAPIMCYFLVEGFLHTSSKQKYATRLFVFALISQIPFSLLFMGKLLIPTFNMVYTLFLCFMMLYAQETIHNLFVKILFTLCIFGLSIFGDWALIAPAMVLTFYYFRNKKSILIPVFCFISLCSGSYFLIQRIIKGYNWWKDWWQYGLLLFVPLLLNYNGESGKKSSFNKWFFYVYYPLHLAIIYVVRGFALDFFPFRIY